MVTREGVLIIIPCPICEHDMLQKTGLIVEPKSRMAKCQRCGNLFPVSNLHVFRALNQKKCIKALTQNEITMQFPNLDLSSLN